METLGALFAVICLDFCANVACAVKTQPNVGIVICFFVTLRKMKALRPNKAMRRISILLLTMLLSVIMVHAQKREFRGAWIQAVNGQFMGMSTRQMQQTLTYQLDELQKME